MRSLPISEPARCILADDALRLINVNTFYGDSHILHDVSFSLAPGGVVALLGRNGAGKTTCISTIIGFIKPRRGEILLFGEPIEGLSPERISHLGIGLVPQGRRIFPSLSVRENLAVAGTANHAALGLGPLIGSTICSPGYANAMPNSPGHFQVGSNRCSRSRARSWETHACC